MKPLTPFIRSAFNYDTKAASDESAITCADPSLAQQQFRDDADINTIVARFGLTGQLPDNGRYPAYGSFDGVFDYHTAQNAILAAQAAFMALPAAVRTRFSNDPQNLLEFASDPANLPELRSLGLAHPIPSEPAPAVPAPADPAAPGKPAVAP